MNTALAALHARILPGMRSLPLALMAGWLLACQARVVAQTTAGIITGTETWSGAVDVTGDVIIDDGATVTIQAGTTVRFASTDSTGRGDPAKTEFSLRGGTLRVFGTSNAPVRFVSAAATPAPGDWHGMFFWYGTADIRYLRQSHAVTGLTIGGGGDYVFSNGSFDSNSTDGVSFTATGRYELTDISAARNGRYGLSSSVAQPILSLTGGVLADNQQGLNASGPLTLLGVQVLRNSGLGVYFSGGSGGAPLRMEDCRVESNGGDGIYWPYNSVSMSGVQSLRNSGSGLNHVGDGGTGVLVEDSEFSFNQGRGLSSGSRSGSPSTTVKRSRFRNNNAEGVRADGGELRVSASTLTGNASGVWSGGGGLSLVDSVITGSTGPGATTLGPILSPGFSGNQIRNNGLGFESAWADGSGVVLISGNDIYGNSGIDIRASGAAEVRATGNHHGVITTRELSEGRLNLSQIWDVNDQSGYGRVVITDPLASSITTLGTPPSITVQPQSVSVDSGNPVAFEVTAAGTEPLTYRWQFAESDLSEGGRFSGTATRRLAISGVLVGDGGGYRVVVGNAHGSITSQVATLTVRPNRAPSFGVLPAFTVNEGSLWNLQLTATDPDGPAQALTFGLVSGPPGLSISAAGLVSWTPGESQGPGTFTVRARVLDGGTPPAQAEAEFTVSVLEVNQPPVPSPVADIPVLAGGTAMATLSATDLDLPANLLTYALLDFPPGAAVTPAGAFSWPVPDGQPAGIVTIRARVTDSAVPVGSAEFTFRVSVSRASGDQPPTVSDFEDVRIERNHATAWIPFTIGDDRTAPSALTVRVGSTNTVLVPAGSISLDGSGADRRLMVRPAPDQSGETWIVVSVTDGAGQTTERSFRLSVCPCDGPTLDIDLMALLTIHGEVGTTYRIEYADTADGPWRFLGTIRLQRSPQTYIDASVSARQLRLYRVIAMAASASAEPETPGSLIPVIR